ncbi:UNVERIFIED_CONTAM: hypothetical protein FKN15_036369 [Acipenser sinensis]
MMSKEEQNAHSLAASWDEESFLRTETQDPDLTRVTAPNSKLASEPEIPVFSNSVQALMERAAKFLAAQVCFPTSSHVDPPALSGAPGFPGGAEAVGLAQFPPVDSTIAALVQRGSDISPGVPQMAQENLVFKPLPAATGPALGDPTAYGSPHPGERHLLTPRTMQTPAVGLPTGSQMQYTAER